MTNENYPTVCARLLVKLFLTPKSSSKSWFVLQPKPLTVEEESENTEILG